MSVARVTEIKEASTKSFNDDRRRGIAGANKTFKSVKSAWVQNQEVMVTDKGEIGEYRVQPKFTFILED